MDDPEDPARARFLRAAGGATLALAARVGGAAPAASDASLDAMNTRPVPSSGEPLPVIGCGTWLGFDVPDGDAATVARLGAVVDALLAGGGRVVDSSPMYGRAEAVTGRLLARQPAPTAFVATKVWTSGRAAGVEQMENSLRLLGRVDLMQVHNLLDWRTHLPTLRRWKDDGRIRYVGVTHYTAGAYRELEAVMRAEALDFVQVNYALDDRAAEECILPLAAERGMAVLVNRPFGGGTLMRRLATRPLPTFAADIGAASWSQVLLKFVLAHPAVTCVVPGTGNPDHMRENVAAGHGDLPGRAFWTARIAEIEG